MEHVAPIGTGFGGLREPAFTEPSMVRRLNRHAVVATIVCSGVLVAGFDFWSSPQLIGSILFTFPLALCALQSSTRLLWGSAAAAVAVSISANFWGLDRVASATSFYIAVNRVLLVGGLLALTALVHLRIRQARENVRDRMELERQNARRILVEEELRADQVRYHLLFDGIVDSAIFMLDVQGRVTSWNAGAERIKGYTASEILGQDFACFFSRQDIERGRPQAILLSASSGIRHKEQSMRTRKDGSHFLASVTVTAMRDSAGKLLGFSELSHDLSESVASEARYRGLLEAAPDAMVVVNKDEKIVLLNVQAEHQFGYPRDELLGQPLQNIIPQGFAERLIADGTRSTAAALAQQIGTGIELLGRRKDGSEFPIEIMLSPLASPDGILVTAAIRNISERKKAEAHLVQMVENLRRSNEELEKFAYVASHDLQEPLRMVSSYTQLLAKRYQGQLDADADEFIGYAVDGANRMQGLIQDLLVYSSVGMSGRALVQTSTEMVFADALRDLHPTIVAAEAVVTHDPLPTIETDATLLAQVFRNLIGNAIKYRRAETPRVHVAAADHGNREWIFSVRDNGLGIAPEYFERIFIIFQRLHRRDEFEGTGIGLAICKKTVERLGGRIWVESQPGEGSVFYFALPKTGDKRVQ